MQIIVVDKRLARALTLSITRRHALAASITFALGVLLLSGAFSFLTVRAASVIRIPILSDLISFVTRDEMERNDQFVRDNVSALARKLGEVQAQLLRLDAVGERVGKAAGIRPEEFRFAQLPGRGGAIPSNDPMTLRELDVALKQLSASVEQRADYMSVIEAELRAQQVRQALLPHTKPISDGFIGSGFGWRADPFSGEMSHHSGIDFAAPTGTPIHAAAGGVVVVAGYHPVWGNIVEVDHGNSLLSRYAHASRLNVAVGDLVKRGQKLAEVGSTGRSTGSHLHFEVHQQGVAQNPAKFLFAKGSPLQQHAAGSPR
ncbi:MAG TPA: M23 family metallopeptidase [Burkholderiaceae bacterium]|jgi:murein DD-endopeptidase MepM/ murein hydrolase activator NlpD|nr:M23 family metallopeptidase [Burkholderiaceae bacterium]